MNTINVYLCRLAGSGSQIETRHLDLNGHLGVRGGILSADTGSLDDDLLVTQLHAIQARYRL